MSKSAGSMAGAVASAEELPSWWWVCSSPAEVSPSSVEIAGVSQLRAARSFVKFSPPSWDHVMQVAERNSMPIDAHTPPEAYQENVRRSPLCFHTVRNYVAQRRVFLARMT